MVPISPTIPLQLSPPVPFLFLEKLNAQLKHNEINGRFGRNLERF